MHLPREHALGLSMLSASHHRTDGDVAFNPLAIVRG